jgi:hypothetical protein
MSFKCIRAISPEDHSIVYCDKREHVTLVPPKNAYAHEDYGVTIVPCDCIEKASLEQVLGDNWTDR